jgi:tripartite-type tricarboxylate transporter receptor subunit TctC
MEGIVKKTSHWTIGLAVVISVFSGAALSQQYPMKSIRMVVPYPPGGGTDLLARSIIQLLGEKLGQNVTVDNRSGANGMIGADIVAKSPADGYTVLLATSAEVALNAAVYRKMPYNPERDFAPVTLLANSPLVLAIHPSLPARNVKDFISLAKNRPGEISYGSGGAGGPHHVAGEWMKLIAKINLIHVPYKGGGPLLVDLMGGHLHTAIIALPVVAPYVKTEKVRALAVTSAKRSPALPQVPTLNESGLQGLDVSQWWGMLVPAGTPRDIVARLHNDVIGIVKLPKILARMTELGMEPVVTSPSQMGELIHSEIVKYRKIVSEAKIVID